MYNLKTPAIQKLVSKLVIECEEYFSLNISSMEEKYKLFINVVHYFIKVLYSLLSQKVLLLKDC